MRRKVYTKDQILKAAYDVVAKEGFKGFTARNIAKKMGISTQPIYLEFKNMEDLKNTLLDSIFEQLKENVFPVERTGDKIIDLGLNYIYFAKNIIVFTWHYISTNMAMDKKCMIFLITISVKSSNKIIDTTSCQMNTLMHYTLEPGLQLPESHL